MADGTGNQSSTNGPTGPVRRALEVACSITLYLAQVAAPVALVYFSYQTANIIKSQNAIIAVQNKAEIGFVPTLNFHDHAFDEKLSSPLQIGITNEGAMLRSLSVEAFGYLEFTYTSVDHPDGPSMQFPALLAPVQVEKVGALTKEVAVLTMPYSMAFMRNLEKHIKEYVPEQFARTAKPLKNYIRSVSVNALIEIVVQNRDETYSNLFFHIENGSFRPLSLNAAMREYVAAEAGTGIMISSTLVTSPSANIEDFPSPGDFDSFYRLLSNRADCKFLQQIARLRPAREPLVTAAQGAIIHFDTRVMLPGSFNTCDLKQQGSGLNDNDFRDQPYLDE